MNNKWKNINRYKKYEIHNSQNNLVGKKRRNSNTNDENNICEIPGYFYDKVKNRYFSLKGNFQPNNIQKEIPERKIKFKSNLNKSKFLVIHNSKLIGKKYLKKIYNRAKYLEESNYINFFYEIL